MAGYQTVVKWALREASDAAKREAMSRAADYWNEHKGEIQELTEDQVHTLMGDLVRQWGLDP